MSSRTETTTWTPTGIRAWVDRHGGNVTALARRLGIGRTHLQDLLSGRREPSRALVAHMETLNELAAASGPLNE